MVNHAGVPSGNQPAAALSEDDLARLATALKAGKRPTVYLRDAVTSLGVPAASSARVVSVRAGTVTVRPKGVGDDVPFEAGELYATRAAAIGAAAGQRTAPASARTRPRRPAVAATPAPTPRGAGAGVSVTITGSADGAWTVQCASGSHRPRSPSPVDADAVARAVAALDNKAVSAAVAAVLDIARRAAAERVAALSAQLEAAQATLQDLH